LQLRIDIADQLLQLRSFAKLDALNFGWPQHGQLVHANRTAINELERNAAAIKDKDPLQQLLLLRPWFSEIPDALIAQYFQMAQAVAAPAGAAAVHAAPPAAGERPAIGARPAISERPVRVDDSVRYENVTLELVPVSDSSYTVHLTHNGKAAAPPGATQI